MPVDARTRRKIMHKDGNQKGKAGGGYGCMEDFFFLVGICASGILGFFFGFVYSSKLEVLFVGRAKLVRMTGENHVACAVVCIDAYS